MRTKAFTNTDHRTNKTTTALLPVQVGMRAAASQRHPN